jgi:isoleucyl-tRNA synthetase
MAEIAITSGLVIRTGTPPEGAFVLGELGGVGVEADRAAGSKCARCWMILAEVGSHAAHPHLCNRCNDAVTP